MTTEYKVITNYDEDHPYSDQHGDGHYLRETWYHEGKIHRTNGPAVTLRHPVTLIAVREQFFHLGQLHGSPAIIFRDPHSGEKLSEQSYLFGERETPEDTNAPTPYGL